LIDKKSTHYKRAYSYFSVIKNLVDIEAPRKSIELANIKEIRKFAFLNLNKKIKIRTLFSSYIGDNKINNFCIKCLIIQIINDKIMR